MSKLTDLATATIQDMGLGRVERVAVLRPLTDGTLPVLAVIDGSEQEFLITPDAVFMRGIRADEDRSDAIESPRWMRQIAQQALVWHKAGKSGSGLQTDTINRAKRVARGGSLTLEEVKQIPAWIARHQPDKRAEGFRDADNPTPGRVAFAFWFSDGSAAGDNRIRAWAQEQISQSGGSR